jgi:hypothetical protein
MSLKCEIYNLVDSGSDYREIISQVTKLIVEKALLTSRGNQTQASKLVKMSLGFAPVRRGRVQVRFADGSTEIGKTRRFDWTLVKQWRPLV